MRYFALVIGMIYRYPGGNGSGYSRHVVLNMSERIRLVIDFAENCRIPFLEQASANTFNATQSSHSMYVYIYLSDMDTQIIQ